MQRIAIIGFPLGHSISPHFQQAALDYYGLSAHYETWEVPVQALPQVIPRLRQADCLGANVTVPFKEAVLPLLDVLEPRAERIGAVNTIAKKGSRLIGYNTDAQGFLRALREDANFDPRGRCALLLGAGGAAHAVAFALAEDGIASLFLANRNLERAEQLAHSLRLSGYQGRIEVIPLEIARLSTFLRQSQLLVHCTPMGTKGSPEQGRSLLSSEDIPQGTLVYDLVYNPPETPLLQEAQRAGARSLGGLPMLVYQGAASFQRWTGKGPPLEVMFAAARRALGSIKS